MHYTRIICFSKNVHIYIYVSNNKLTRVRVYPKTAPFSFHGTVQIFLSFFATAFSAPAVSSWQMKCTSLAAQKIIPPRCLSFFSFFESVYYMTRRNCTTGNVNAIIAKCLCFCVMYLVQLCIMVLLQVHKFNFATSMSVNVYIDFGWEVRKCTTSIER